MLKSLTRLFLSIVLAFFVTFGLETATFAQTVDGGSSTITGVNADSGILDVTFNGMPPFEQGGNIPPIDLNTVDIGYNIARTWSAGDAPANVVKIGDIDTGLAASQLTLQQIAEQAGFDLQDITLGQLNFLEGISLAEFVNDVPLLEDWPVVELNIPDGILGPLGIDASSSETLSSAIQGIPELGDLAVRDVFGGTSIADIPNLEFSQLLDFEGIGDNVISNVPGLGDIPLGSFPGVGGLAGAPNFFAHQDIAFGSDEYSGLEPTPAPVSGGTDGGKNWKAIPCIGGCAHIELSQPGWEGATWMTKAHRVKDGYGLLGNLFDEAGAYRLPFGDSFALQITDTDEAEGTASWGIAFRVCRQALFVDLGCTAYFLEAPLGITTHEEDIVLTGLRDLMGGASQPVAAPPGWEDLRPDAPPELAQYVSQYLPPSVGRGSPVIMDEDCLSGILAATPTSQVDGAKENIPIIIEAANKHGLSRDQTAYVLATVRMETGPAGWGADVEEWGAPCGYDGGCGWHGRGYVQLTHRSNYEYVGNQLGIDLVGNPDLALQNDIAAEILVAGMKNGWYNGQGHGLDYYINDQRQDWVNARRTVNILNKADLIDDWAQQYSQALGQCKTLETTRGSIGSPLAGVSLEEAIAYQPSPGQSFTARREYRNGWHAGIDFDSRIGAGEGGRVTSVTSGEIREIRRISTTASGEGSVSVRIVSRDSEGRLIEQRYTHLSESSVRQALGVGPGEGAGMQIAAGQQVGLVGATDRVSSGAHLDYKVIVDGQFSDPQQFLQAVANGGGALRTIGVTTGAIGQTQVGAFEP